MSAQLHADRHHERLRACGRRRGRSGLSLLLGVIKRSFSSLSWSAYFLAAFGLLRFGRLVRFVSHADNGRVSPQLHVRDHCEYSGAPGMSCCQSPNNQFIIYLPRNHLLIL